MSIVPDETAKNGGRETSMEHLMVEIETLSLKNAQTDRLTLRAPGLDNTPPPLELKLPIVDKQFELADLEPEEIKLGDLVHPCYYLTKDESKLYLIVDEGQETYFSIYLFPEFKLYSRFTLN